MESQLFLMGGFLSTNEQNNSENNSDVVESISTTDESLKSCVENPIKSTECAICMQEYGNTNRMILRCGHQFCCDCILHHFQFEGGTACPLCREEFATRVKYWKPPGSYYHNDSDDDSDEDSDYDSDYLSEVGSDIDSLILDQILTTIGKEDIESEPDDELLPDRKFKRDNLVM